MQSRGGLFSEKKVALQLQKWGRLVKQSTKQEADSDYFVPITIPTTEYKLVTCIYNDHSMYIWDVHDVKKIGKSRSFLFHSSFIYSLELLKKSFEGWIIDYEQQNYIIMTLESYKEKCK